MNRSFYRMIHEKHLRNEKKKMYIYIYIYMDTAMSNIIRTEKIGVLEAFGTNEKNFKRSWCGCHLWREVSRN